MAYRPHVISAGPNTPHIYLSVLLRGHSTLITSLIIMKQQDIARPGLGAIQHCQSHIAGMISCYFVIQTLIIMMDTPYK